MLAFGRSGERAQSAMAAKRASPRIARPAYSGRTCGICDKAINPIPTASPAAASGFGTAGKRHRAKDDTTLIPIPRIRGESIGPLYHRPRVSKTTNVDAAAGRKKAGSGAGKRRPTRPPSTPSGPLRGPRQRPWQRRGVRARRGQPRCQSHQRAQMIDDPIRSGSYHRDAKHDPKTSQWLNSSRRVSVASPARTPCRCSPPSK